MTTNSPKPVDGDVQALIEQCKHNIDTLNVALKHCDQEEADEIYRNLELQKVALASLTDVPVVEVNTWWPLGVDGGEQPFLQPLGNLPAKGSKLYTTPPAQLLRPVELPGGFSPAIGDIFDRQAPVMRRDREEGCWIHKAVVAELLRSLGHEVKE